MSLVIGAVLALVPSLTALADLGTSPGTSVPAAVLALALAAWCGAARGCGVALAATADLAPAPTYDDRGPRRSCTTDPVHHPRRPRAPGTA